MGVVGPENLNTGSEPIQSNPIHVSSANQIREFLFSTNREPPPIRGGAIWLVLRTSQPRKTPTNQNMILYLLTNHNAIIFHPRGDGHELSWKAGLDCLLPVVNRPAGRTWLWHRYIAGNLYSTAKTTQTRLKPSYSAWMIWNLVLVTLTRTSILCRIFARLKSLVFLLC